MERQRAGNYGSLLDEAFGLGRTDGGALAASAGPATDPGSSLCAGLEPEEFAALLWAPRPGAPPAGLVLNAPHWYAAGLRSARSDPVPVRLPHPRLPGRHEDDVRSRGR